MRRYYGALSEGQADQILEDGTILDECLPSAGVQLPSSGLDIGEENTSRESAKGQVQTQ